MGSKHLKKLTPQTLICVENCRNEINYLFIMENLLQY